MKPTPFLTETPIAHRGLHNGAQNTLHGYVPENSMRAFENAIDMGFAIETDVRLTKDNVLVVFHDETLTRMTGVKKRVIDCTLEEVRSYLLEGSDPIPTFQEFLKILAGRAPLLLEIKNVPEVKTDVYIGQIVKELEGYTGEYAVQTFQPAYVKAFKKLRPDIPCGILASASSVKADYDGSPIWRIKRHFVKNMTLNAFVKPDFVSYCFSDLPQKKVSKFKGVKLGWTVRSEADEKKARKLVDNIIFENFIPKNA